MVVEEAQDPIPTNSEQELRTALNGRIGYLLKQVTTRFAQLSTTALAPFGIQGRELAVLSVLRAHGPVSQRELSHTLHVDRTTMVSLIDQLEEKGLAQRARNSRDRRVYDVGLTEDGRSITAKADAAAARTEAELLASLTPAAAWEFRQMLHTIAQPPQAGG